MSLRIAHLVAYPYHGGTQEYALGLAEAQMLLGHDVTVFAVGHLTGNYHLKIIKAKPFVTLLRNPISFRVPLNILRAITAFDAVHIHLPFPVTSDFLVLLIALLRKKRHSVIVATYHFDIALESVGGRLISPFYNYATLEFVLSNIDKIFVSSKAFSEGSPILLKQRKRIFLMPLGINTSLYRPCYAKSSQIVFVGRLIPEKGIHYLIQALPYLDEQTCLTIIGKAVDRHYYRSLLHLCEKLGVHERVNFAGNVTNAELRDFYCAAQVVVLPSTTRLESFGLTLLEAMATGKPVIATNIIPGAVELIKKSKCGVLVPPRDPVALAKAIRLLRHDSPCGIGSKARKYVELFHDWNIVARKVVAVYEKTLTEKKQKS